MYAVRNVRQVISRRGNDVPWTASSTCHPVKPVPTDASSLSSTKLRRMSSEYLIACDGMSCGRRGISWSSVSLAVDERTTVHGSAEESRLVSASRYIGKTSVPFSRYGAVFDVSSTSRIVGSILRQSDLKD